MRSESYLSISGMRNRIDEWVVDGGELSENSWKHSGEWSESGAPGESPQQRYHCNTTRKCIILTT